MVAEPTTKRMKDLYQDEVIVRLMKEFNLKNIHQVPRLTKIIVNCGIGRFLENQKLKPEIRDTVFDTLTTVTGQRPILIRAKKSVSNFKVREGSPSAIMVTLRGERMWSFLERLIHLAIPRFKDFRGLKTTAFDPEGNYSLGLTEQAVWPEINMAKVNFTHGMNVNIVIDNSNPEMSKFLLGELGMPFVREED